MNWKKGPGLVILLLAAKGYGPSVGERVDWERAIERARYQFVIGNTKPFDEVYPRSIFEKRVARELEQERVLKRVFGITVTPALLSAEFDRIERSTKAPDQWEAIKKALENDGRLIEEVFCRPLLVDRALRARFAFDQTIHAGPHQKARDARNAFLAGREVAGSRAIEVRRQSEKAPTAEELLGKAKEDSSLPRVLAPGKDLERERAGPVSLDPEVTAVLEKELKRPGDVTTILEERDCFEVFRLIAISGDSWKLDAVRYAKRDFDSWLEKQRKK